MSQTQIDLIVHNGLIWTGDEARPQAEALAVAAGRIVAVGSSREILERFVAPKACCIDLEQRRLIPGLHDTHMHLMNTGLMLTKVQLTGCRSIAEMIRRFQEAPETDGWLIGRGFLHDLFSEQRLPTCHDLDQVSRERPVFATRACGHIAVCNSVLLQMAGIVKGFGQVEGGEIGYDADGEPNGILAERAIGLVARLMPEATPAELQRAVARASREMVAVGLTAVQTDDLGNTNWELSHDAYAAAAQEGDLKLRVFHQLRFDKPEDVARFSAWREANAKKYALNPESFGYGPVKLMCDGSLGGRTAAMSDPYVNAPETCGVTVLSRKEMAAILCEAHSAGYQLSGHAIGDRAISDLIEAMAEAIPTEQRAAARPRVIHAQITTPKLLARMQELHIHCDIQPAFVATDYPIVAACVGEDKARTSYAWATMRRLGITTSGGSDSPVESFNPFYGIYCAVTRCDADGAPAGGWNPAERLSVEEALRLYTADSAYAVQREDRLGRLIPGQHADFVLLDRDILRVDPAQIKEIQALAVWIGGELVHRT